MQGLGPRQLLVGAVAVTTVIAAALSLDPAPAPPLKAVEVPALARGGSSSLGRVVVTARWGQTAGSRATAPGSPGAHEQRWDGSLEVDCGRIESVTPLAMELGSLERHDDPIGEDAVFAVTDGGEGASVAFRSRTRNGWDGLRAVVVACRQRGDGGSTVTVRTMRRQHALRLAWSADDFVALPVDDRGNSLEIHVGAALDARSQDGSRVTRSEGGAMASR